MTRSLISYSSLAALALLAVPTAVQADANPNFEEDATPILHMQPGLLQYVEARFDIKGTGTAKYPGDDDHPPAPPYIFRARPLGSSGPYNLRLLIQPGSPGHILGVVDITKVHLTEPGAPMAPPRAPVASNQPPAANRPVAQPTQQAPSVASKAPVQAEPNYETPSGPIYDTASPDTTSTSANAAPSLQPPPDLPPAH